VLLNEVRLLFAYDRWATRRILNTAEDTMPEVWSRPEAVGDRGLAGVLVHALGAHARWRSAWQGSGEKPRPEAEPLLSPAELRSRWEAEWAALDAWFAGLAPEAPNRIWDGLPIWQTMVHVVNHGTQHRSEAAALLTAEGHSPGELDLVDFLNEGTTD
jgi:uncharacterized damage-inducible protein DinB